MNNMKELKMRSAALLIACCAALASAPAHAWEPSARDRDAAINAGRIDGYFAKLTAWLSRKAPATPGQVTKKNLAT